MRDRREYHKRYREENIEYFRKYREKNRKWMKKWIKLHGGRCYLCNEVAEFGDHLDASTKWRDLSKIFDEEKWWKEAEKCKPVCKSCNSRKGMTIDHSRKGVSRLPETLRKMSEYMKGRVGNSHPRFKQSHCNIVGCNGVHRAKGFCPKHYKQHWRRNRDER